MPGAGLPEEASVVRTALGMSYVPIAFSSVDRESGCWDAQWLDKSKDILAVRPCTLPCKPSGSHAPHTAAHP